MWPIDFENPARFHISIGAGLIVATFILLLFISKEQNEETKIYIDSIKNDYNFLHDLNYSNNESIIIANQLLNLRKSKADTFYNQIKLLSNLGWSVFVCGSLIFLFGYIQYIRNYYHNKK